MMSLRKPERKPPGRLGAGVEVLGGVAVVVVVVLAGASDVDVAGSVAAGGALLDVTGITSASLSAWSRTCDKHTG